jgi:hypothetical protein
MGHGPSKIIYRSYVADGYYRHPDPALSNYVLVPKNVKSVDGITGRYDRIENNWVLEIDPRPESKPLSIKSFISRLCKMVMFLVKGRIYRMPVYNIE